MTGRLLIFDDEPAVGRMVEKIAQRAGMLARYCSNADQFFEQLGHWQPSHVFIDLVMPELDGVEVLSRLAQARATAGIIIASGLGGRVLQAAQRSAQARGLPVLGVLAKPFSTRALRALLAASPAAAAGGTEQAQGPALLAEELERGLRNDEFFVVYQPKWLLAQQRVSGIEALVRWDHPTLGILSPDTFIPLAEGTGRIGALTDRIVEISLAWFAGLASTAMPSLELNISGSSLDAGLPERLADRCHAARVARERVVLEITETSQICDALGASEVLSRLRIKGFGLAIDDFGMGYSSMSQLAMFPFTELKIDKSFVADMHHSAAMRSVVHSSIGLAQQMGMSTVAEGVEREGTAAALAAMGCDAVQGYAIAPPMRADSASLWIRERDR
ncbi:EAL domain-containing response regulator [Noviherbaspirillum pedocola]|uniref:EAL domain-containing response regulator n=1 Tax=Noviherbaspirillum pedocola TaxID=2801341 RepID=A0A934SVE0_9BURK|nr:EAL domain-containing response regulator [Noviherbaspirillum pedocola]MBK4733439.1 EAL domain-containing response regulator [Noviherbaspirillum pedocola]